MGGTVVSATDEAVVLYLRALHTDLANHAMALKLMVELQMAQGEFERALASAQDATRTARGLSASLREKLDDTRRDARSVDWVDDMPKWLHDVLGQIGSQLERDRQLKVLAGKAGEDPEVAGSCREIVEEVRRSEDVWVRLERRLQSAIPTFLNAQEAQRFTLSGLASAIDLVTDLLRPALLAANNVLDAGADLFAANVAPPVLPPQWCLDELCKQLLRPPVTWERSEAEVDDPGELGEETGVSIPDDVATVAAQVLESAKGGTRLSALFETARSRADEVGDPERLLDIIWGAAFWVYVAAADVSPDDMPQNHELAAAVQNLVATIDEVQLDDDRYYGPDLYLASSLVLDVADLDAEQGVA